MTIKYPFSSKLISEKELLDWLTETIYPREYRRGGASKTLAKNRIRSRINKARKKDIDSNQAKKLAKRKEDSVDSHAFFEWACKQRGWGILEKIDRLPREVTVEINSTPSIRAEINSPKSLTIPKDYPSLKKEFVALHREHSKALDEIKKLETSSRELELKVEKLEKRRQEASEHGKKAKGVKKTHTNLERL